MKVVLVVDPNGDIIEVTSQETGEVFPFDIQNASTKNTELDSAVSTMCAGSRVDSRTRRALNHAVSASGGRAAACIPLPHCGFDGRLLRGCVHVLDPDGAPPPSGWPLSLQYATGISKIEVDRRLLHGAYMSVDFVKSPEFSARAADAVRRLSQPQGVPPGLVNPGTSALAALHTCTSEAYPADPLLRTYKPGYLKTWKPHLKENDFIRICSSSWDSVHPRTAAAFGHSPQDTHFDVVLCWHLPEEMADQLLQLACLNPDGDSWTQMAKRKEFELATSVSVAARENILRRFMEVCGLAPSPGTQFVHTLSDVLVADVTAGEVSDGVAFYSGCTPTDRQNGGVLSLSQSDANLPMYWWHGPHTTESQGGGAWEMPPSMHGFPVVGTGLQWRKDVLRVLSEAGHRIENGYAKLTPII